MRAKFLALADSLSGALSDTLARVTSKAFALSVIVSEAFSRQTGHQLIESFSLGDAFATARVKVLALADSLASFADSLTRSTARGMADLWTLTDQAARQPARSLADGLIVGEKAVRNATRSLAESVLIADLLATAAARIRLFAETLALADSYAQLTAHSINETVAPTDTLARQTGRALVEAMLAVEAFSRGSTKNLTDALPWIETLSTALVNLGAVTQKFVAQLWQRLWAAAPPVRLFSAALPLRSWRPLSQQEDLMITTDPKDAEAIEDFSIDWSALGADLIVSSTWEIPADLTEVASSNSTNSAIVRLAGGVGGRKYVVKNLVTLESGQVRTQTLLVPVQQ